MLHFYFFYSWHFRWVLTKAPVFIFCGWVYSRHFRRTRKQRMSNPKLFFFFWHSHLLIRLLPLHDSRTTFCAFPKKFKHKKLFCIHRTLRLLFFRPTSKKKKRIVKGIWTPRNEGRSCSPATIEESFFGFCWRQKKMHASMVVQPDFYFRHLH